MPLRAITIFRAVSQAALDGIAQASTTFIPRDGAIIFEQGDPADSVYGMVAGDGHVRLGTIDRRSKALMIELIQAGDVFGELGVITGGTRTASAVIKGRVVLTRIPAASFRSALATCSPLSEAVCELLAARLERTFQLLQDATFETVEVRLARQILYLAERHSRNTPSGMRLSGRFRQGDLADLLGTTTRSIITILNAWRSDGLVAYDADRAILTVRDITGLRMIVHAEDKAT